MIEPSPFGSRLPILTGDDVVLRPLRPDELRGVATAVTTDPDVSRWWSSDPDKLRHWLQDSNSVVYVVELPDRSEEVVGVIAASSHRSDPDHEHASLDIALFSGARGRGLGADALRTMARWLFSARGFHRITIDPAADNEATVRACEKAGFRRVGIAREYERGDDGTWRDNMILDLLPGDLGLSKDG